MADSSPLLINSATRYMIGPTCAAWGVSGLTAPATWPSANLAIYVPLALPWSYTINRFFWANSTTVSGNVAVGLYTLGGSALSNQAAVAQTGTSTFQYLTLTAPVTLSAGNYLLGIAFSSATATVISTSLTAAQGQSAGLYQQALGGLPFPSSYTLASYAQTIGAPLMGITRTTTGF